jgi:hypothetical protein
MPGSKQQPARKRAPIGAEAPMPTNIVEYGTFSYIPFPE